MSSTSNPVNVPSPLDPEQGNASSNTTSNKPKKPSEDDEKFWNIILGLLLFLVCLMLYNELVRHYNHRQQVYWDEHYLAAVRGDPSDWKFGYRLEDLEQRIISQRDVLSFESKVLDEESDGIFTKLSHKWHHQMPSHDTAADLFHEEEINPTSSQHQLASKIYSQIENSSSYHTISCIARPSFYLRVGPDDFRDVPTDRCQVFSGASSESVLGAHALWEKVSLGNGAIGFRALSNGKFLKVVPPKGDEWNAPWKVEVVSPLPGLGERFQLIGGKLYSELMHGYMQCGGDGLAEPLKGFPGETIYEESSVYLFNVSEVSPTELAHGRQLKEASSYISSVYDDSASLPKFSNRPPPLVNKKGYKIALCVPMTSRGTDMSAVDQSPIWFNLFASFMESIDWSNNKHEFTFYLGLDKGDPLYDTGDAWSELRASFNKNTRRALSWLNYDNSSIAEHVLNKQLKLKLMDFSDTTGAPSQVVVGLVNQAYDDGFDYFFQVNDDTVIVSKDWATSFITALTNNPIHSNLGITGPVDTNNDRILTHAFAHRTHIEIFGRFFPKTFKNWWSDDWISTVYGSKHTFRMYDVLVTHNVQSQKTGAFNRYAVDESAKFALRRELSLGFVAINKWLNANHLPRLPLPSICGYSPLIGDLYEDLVKRAIARVG